ncbi:1-acyl-sn-glycerol-3-phosphate acyltransferase [Dehalogenimonas formicexedens]|uniref:1-acyl-sn-glycerol-3-phosphate acyltransferase n=1 Tax=Dehalogenimonas formicexedens TaxID=1839801 RepID=A0A1P8F9M3_9CHLR|nr:lysophospholipid acyltransferase family protein [Dehalogenimonas formicexedens]APV45167.1 1-acyl-sn-glycerol-3-phosphate acyltransferase [Dehalogenimonas formicexedens]
MKFAWYYRLVRLSARIVFIFTRVKVIGKENVPSTGPMLVCSNHIHLADPPLLGLNLPRYPVYFLAKKELFGNKFVGFIFRGSGTIPVNRTGVSGEGIKLSQSAFKKGGAIIIFPEGKRNPAATLCQALPGAAYLAATFGVPVVPTAILGTENIKGKWWFLKPRTVTIQFGKPFNLEACPDKNDREALAAQGDRIMKAIAELLPVPNRGVYGEKA